MFTKPRTVLLTAVLAGLTISAAIVFILKESVFDYNSFSSDALKLDANESESQEPVIPEITKLQSSFETWSKHLLETSPQGIQTKRTICRELESGTQSCVFEGIVCVNVTSEAPSQPVYYFVDDSKPDDTEVPHDGWCIWTHTYADPRIFANRQWPILTNTVIPQRSCILGRYRNSSSLFGSSLSGSNENRQRPRIRWLTSLHAVYLMFASNDHNDHLLKDIIWLLDTTLFQASLDLKQRPGYTDYRENDDEDTHFFRRPQHIYLPQTQQNFVAQTGRDVNRLTYSIVLQKDIRKLYPQLTDDQLHNNSFWGIGRKATPLLDAFPELIDNNELVFHGDLLTQSDTDLVCTPRITIGSRSQDTGHERNCRYIRSKTYELYGIQRPPLRRVGFATYPQPPKSILILNRHINRDIGNGMELFETLKEAFGPHDVEVKYITTTNLSTAEDFVRLYSSAGVIISPHGSHNMGAIWMQRYRYVRTLASPLFLFFFDSVDIVSMSEIRSYSQSISTY